MRMLVARLLAIIVAVSIGLTFSPTVAATPKGSPIVPNYGREVVEYSTLNTMSVGHGPEFIMPAADLLASKACVGTCCAPSCCATAVSSQIPNLIGPGCDEHRFPAKAAFAGGVRIADRFRPPVA